MPVTAEILGSRTTPHLSWNHSFPPGGSPNLDAWASLRKATEFVAEEFSRSGFRTLQNQNSDMRRTSLADQARFRRAPRPRCLGLRPWGRRLSGVGGDSVRGRSPERGRA